MRRTNWLMKLLLITPVVLLLCLLIWVISDQIKLKEAYLPQEITGSTILAGEGIVGETKDEIPVVTTAPDLSPLEGETEVETEIENSKITMMFGGDVYLSNHVLSAYDKAGGIHGVLDQKIQEQIKESDIFMVNQEFPFSNRGTAAADKQYTFRLPPEKVSIFSEMGIDIVTLANNHALDFGSDALLDTGAALDGVGIRYVGAGENMERAKKLETIKVGGKVIGFLGASRVIPVHTWNANSYTPGMLTTYDPEILLGEIQKAKTVCDYVVVYVHWGIERAEMPKDYQRTLGQQYIDAGADLVIGSHPHVLQGIEYYKDKPIVYSLGNFVFGSSIPKTALLQVELEGENVELSLIPCTSSAGYTKSLDEESKIQDFYRYMEKLSFQVTIDEGGVVKNIP